MLINCHIVEHDLTLNIKCARIGWDENFKQRKTNCLMKLLKGKNVHSMFGEGDISLKIMNSVN